MSQKPLEPSNDPQGDDLFRALGAIFLDGYARMFPADLVSAYLDVPAGPPAQPQISPKPDSGHYKYSPDKRREIVNEYRRARDNGEVLNKDRWARGRYFISGKTLLSYEDEFPENMET